jgi:hypothetical protein
LGQCELRINGKITNQICDSAMPESMQWIINAADVQHSLQSTLKNFWRSRFSNCNNNIHVQDLNGKIIVVDFILFRFNSI